MDSFDKGWFVLQTYSGYENKVKVDIEKTIEANYEALKLAHQEWFIMW